MRRKFSDLGAERFLLTGLVPGPGLGGAWRAMAAEVVERNRVLERVAVAVDDVEEALPKRLRRENNDAMVYCGRGSCVCELKMSLRCFLQLVLFFFFRAKPNVIQFDLLRSSMAVSRPRKLSSSLDLLDWQTQSLPEAG